MTTREQTVFIRLLPFPDKDDALIEALKDINNGYDNSSIQVVNPASFKQVPGSPFAYWVSDRIRELFAELPPFEGAERTVRQGLATADDFRFVRAWWEVSPAKTLCGDAGTTPEQLRQQTFKGKRWVPFSKGGAYSPFYADIHLVVNWERAGEEIRAFVDPDTSRSYSRPQNIHLYFLPGLTWSLRTQAGLSLRALPAGCIFGHKGPVAFDIEVNLLPLLALTNSVAFLQLVAIQMTFGSYEVGVIQRTPVPELSGRSSAKLGELALRCLDLKRTLDTADETSHIFWLPALLQLLGEQVAEQVNTWRDRVKFTGRQLVSLQREIDDIAIRIYGITDEDRRAIKDDKARQVADSDSDNDNDHTEQQVEQYVGDSENDEGNIDSEEGRPGTDPSDLVEGLLSYSVGCAFGRWDVRLSAGERMAPELPDPFAPLPVCSPGMLKGEDGLPLQASPPGYPLAVDWGGILVDDPEHPDDIVRRVRDVFDVVFGERAGAIEQEAGQVLGAGELRDYFRKPGSGGFWIDHVRRYSKSRRKAPIYWLLQSPKRSYGLWLYYHRLDADLLFKALVNYVEPKVNRERSRLEELRDQRQAFGTTGKAAKQIEKAIERQEALLNDVEAFRDRLARAANLNLVPDLDDGVVLNIAPLWELLPWAEAKGYWNDLLQGKYEWSSIGKQLREKGIVK